jgi:hypothetical protein
MKSADKAVIWFFGAFLGVSGAIGLPLWGLMVAGIAVSLLVIAAVIVSSARRRK